MVARINLLLRSDNWALFLFFTMPRSHPPHKAGRVELGEGNDRTTSGLLFEIVTLIVGQVARVY
jgi:hypothetical protein